MQLVVNKESIPFMGCVALVAVGGLIGIKSCLSKKDEEDDEEHQAATICDISPTAAMRVQLSDNFASIGNIEKQVSELQLENISQSHAMEIESLLELLLKELTKIDGTPLLNTEVHEEEARNDMRAVRKEAVSRLKGCEGLLLELKKKTV